MAAGHCTREKREQLFSELAQRAKRLRRLAPSLNLIAAACLETSPDVSPRTRRSVERSLSVLIPPKTLQDAQALAVGPFVLDFLMRSNPKTDQETAATIRAAAVIGGENALPVIRRFLASQSPLVLRELITSWSRFDPELYAKSIVASMNVQQLTVQDPTLAQGLAYVNGIEQLICAVPASGKLDFIPPSVVDLG
jgi:hypothetical protein